jgi:hypothetical protein
MRAAKSPVAVSPTERSTWLRSLRDASPYDVPRGCRWAVTYVGDLSLQIKRLRETGDELTARMTELEFRHRFPRPGRYWLEPLDQRGKRCKGTSYAYYDRAE